MEWNLRLAAAQRGIWRSSDLRRLLAEAGLEISAGKMSHLWSGRPISVRLDDLDIICAVLGCEPGDLLVRDPAAARPAAGTRPRLLRRPGDPAVTAGRPAAAAGMTAAAGQVITCTACGVPGAGPAQSRLVQALLCPRLAPGPALRWLRADRRHLAAGLCARCYRLSRTRLVICPDCGTRARSGSPPVRAVQTPGRRQVRGLPGLRKAGHAAVVGPLPQLRRQVPRSHRRLPRLRGPDQADQRAVQGVPAVPLGPSGRDLPLVRPAAADRRGRGLPVLPARRASRLAPPQAGPGTPAPGCASPRNADPRRSPGPAPTAGTWPGFPADGVRPAAVSAGPTRWGPAPGAGGSSRSARPGPAGPASAPPAPLRRSAGRPAHPGPGPAPCPAVLPPPLDALDQLRAGPRLGRRARCARPAAP